jgi:hypothetical protein
MSIAVWPSLEAENGVKIRLINGMRVCLMIVIQSVKIMQDIRP